MSRGGAGGPEGAFTLERVEHETGGVFGLKGKASEEVESEKAFVPEPEADASGEDSSDDESAPELDQGGQSGAHQEVPVAVRKLYDSFTGAHHVESHEKRTRRCLAPGSDARGGHQLFPTGADHAPQIKGVPGMAKLAACAGKRNGRATRAPGMGGTFPSQREDGTRRQNHLQTKSRKGRVNGKVQVQIRGSGIPTNKRYPLR